MNVERHIVFVDDYGVPHFDARAAAAADVERYLRHIDLGCGERSAGEALVKSLKSHPELVELLMRQYQAALDDADQLKAKIVREQPKEATCKR